MPKLVFESFLRALRKDIVTNYEKGDKYLSVREISEKFSVSLQTAQKGVTELQNDGLIISKPRAGITIAEKDYSRKSLLGKKIIVMSNRQDGRFFSSFYDGVREVL